MEYRHFQTTTTKYLPCILSKELLENAHHSSQRRNQQRETVSCPCRTQGLTQQEKPRRLWRKSPGERLCPRPRGWAVDILQCESGLSSPTRLLLVLHWFNLRPACLWEAWSRVLSTLSCLAHVSMKLLGAPPCPAYRIDKCFLCPTGEAEVGQSEFRNRKSRGVHTCVCDLIWKWSLCGCDQVKMRPHGWSLALIQRPVSL